MICPGLTFRRHAFLKIGVSCGVSSSCNSQRDGARWCVDEVCGTPLNTSDFRGDAFSCSSVLTALPAF